MTDYGVTDLGFVLKRLNDIRNDLITALSDVTDPLSGESLTPNLEDEDDPLVQVVNAFSDVVAECWENLQLAYNQFDPLKASGAGLGGTVQLNGIRRRPGTYSQVVVMMVGTPGLTIDSGAQITTMNDSPIFELPEVKFDETGSAVVVATCTEYGENNVEVGTLVKILTPISGWTSVTNSSTATLGSLEEKDEELRARQRVSTSNTAQTIPEAILAGLINLDGVKFAKIYQNITLSIDSRGIDPKSIAAVVIGGEDEEIAQILFDKLAAGGCDTYGDQEYAIEDSQGIEYTMRFIRPIEINIFVEVEVTVISTVTWPSGTGSADIKAAILAWALTGGQSVDSDALYQIGYYPGRSVYANELFIPVYTVQGIRIDSILVSNADDSASDVGSSEVIIDWNEIAIFSSDNISVTVN